MIELIYKWLGFIVLTIFVSSCSKPEAKLFKMQGGTMGTYYQVTYVLNKAQLADSHLTLKSLQLEINKKLELVNDQMSTFRKNSELSQINKSHSGIVVSDATRDVIKSALKIYQQSDGAYDITIGPLVNLWGFGPDKRINKAPSEALIAKKLKSVGSQYVTIQGNMIHKAIPSLYIDLSSIAKGYGVDVLSEYLVSLGIKNYLVDIGGELRTSGHKPQQKPWKVGVETPSSKDQGVERVVDIGHNAIATSGDYRNFFEKNGIRYSHIINPKTGRPITHNLVSVSVVYSNCKMADGYATAITVLGPKAGFDFAKKHKLAVFLIIKKGNKYIEHYTDNFKRYFVKDPK
ncbi:MAG: FAD:protein FMN transferase [Psychromonas sp.]|nr:FAD:protein FMN transferase [Psychromonas sp.]